MRRINYFTKFIKLIFCKKCLYNFKSIKMVLSVSFFLQDFLKVLNFSLLLDFSTFYNVEQSSRSRIPEIREPFSFFKNYTGIFY